MTSPGVNQPSIPATMRAIRCHGPEDYRIEEIPTPKPGPGEVLVKVDACGICASDVKCYTGAASYWGDADRPPYVQPPVTPGHEFVGTVVALGEGAGDRYGLRIGDRAISEQIVPCGGCWYCRHGKYWLCAENSIYGFRAAAQGGMAEYMLFPAAAYNYRIPENVPVADGALIEPLACAMHAVSRGGIEMGDCVVIAGAGPLGLGMTACARLKNPGQLIVIDTIDSRLEIATSLGADVILNPNRHDVVARVRSMTDGRGCDVYIEATGHPTGVNQGLNMLRKAGTIVEFSVLKEPATTDWTIIGDSKELNIYGAHLGPHCYPVVIDYLSRGLLQVDGIVTHQLPLERFLDGFHLVHEGRESIKVLLRP